MQDQFVRYIRTLGISLCIGLVIVGLTNWVIDPYDDLGRNWIGIYSDNRKEQVKSIISFPHDAILIGSSRTMCINPDNLCAYKFYNASFPGALPEEMYYYLERFAKNEKLVVIALDFSTFNESSLSLSNITKWPDRYWPEHEYLFGWNVFLDSIKAIYNRAYLHNTIKANGYCMIVNGNPPDMGAYRWYINDFVTYVYKDFTSLSETRFQYLRKIKKLLEDRHIKYIVFANPMQEDNWKTVHLTGSYGLYLQWVNRLREIFPGITYFPEGVYSQKELFKNDDPSHYLSPLGEAIVNDLLGCGP